MAIVRFTKMHGIGNDYVYINGFSQQVADLGGLSARISPRRTGIGSDGLILIAPSTVADCRMEMYNADGSRGEMCGNGIRCVGKYVFDHGLVDKTRITVETDAGLKTLDLHVENGRVDSVTVDMGEPILDGPRIPVATEGQVVDAPLEIDGVEYRITCVSMGNPHCVVFVDDVEPLPLETLGPRFEHHPFFPKRVNTEFIQVLNRRALRMRVWERGSGETAACGTGACAALVAGVLNGKSDRRAVLHLVGGDLAIEWSSSDHRVRMTGAATEVFSGEIDV